MISYFDAVTALFAERETPPLCLVRTFGCRQNVSDGEKISGLMMSLGCGFTDDLSAADIIIFNTCAVRESAESRIFGLLGRLKRLKENKNELIIAVCGCMAELEQNREMIKSRHGFVDLVFGTNAIDELPRLLFERLSEKKPIYCETVSAIRKIGEELPILRTCAFKADIPVMYGCDNYCSYCVVPQVRGRERSRNLTDIIAEVKVLAAGGCKEIFLLGQNVNSYGKGLDDDISFPKLLRALNGLDGDFKIRFLSSHPKDAGRDLIDAIAESEKVCKHLHLPLQSGSDHVLCEMNRGYTVEQYLETVRYARELMPGFSFSTDVMVGFPNETYDDFRHTMSVVEQVKFDNIFSFIYSKRPGTKAAEIEDNTSKSDKAAWFEKLLKKQREISAENNKRFIGRTLEVLFDGEKEGVISGKSDEFITVTALGEGDKLVGKRKSVLITNARIAALEGVLQD
jgi:tRNA-2-methylthio-N6-dimethylallyladenosine synthase